MTRFRNPGPAVLGTAKLHSRHRGRQTVKVRLNQRGRKLLGYARQLHVGVIISFSDQGQVLRSQAPFTLKRRRR